MRTRKMKTGLVAPVLLAVMLQGCASKQPKAGQDDQAGYTLESAVAQANAAQAEGRTDQAVSMLKGAASRYPADKIPWLRLAEIRFDAGDYGDAISNATQALQRDPGDKAAHGIVTISGLRLAAGSLAELRTQHALNGALKAEAQELSKTLRESLGESSPPSAPAKPAAPVRGKAVRKPALPPANEAGSGPNPFGNLK